MSILRFVALLVTAGLSHAQASTVAQPQRSFETASIKISAVGGKTFVTSGPRRLVVKNAPLRELIRMAYRIRDFQISGGPAWVKSDHSDLDAKAEGNPTSEEWLQTEGPMLQELLIDRFKLKIRRETQILPVYDLTVAKGGLKFAITKSEEGSCATFKWVRNSPPSGQGASIQCGAVELTNIRLNHTLDAGGMRITGVPGAPGLTTFLSAALDRLVIDKTGLTGLF
jgi:uncharacterized protein (TIGR03435 family)